VALEGGEVLFVEGSAKIDEKGKNRVGYAVTTDSKLVKAGPLPGHLSAQAVELIALTEACKLYKGKEVTIYTDNQYAFATVHQYCQQWKNRGYQTSTGNIASKICWMQYFYQKLLRSANVQHTQKEQTL